MEFSDVLRIAPQKLGVAEIAHSKPSAADRLRGAMHGQPLGRDVYVRLLVRGNVVMTDAEFERATSGEPVRRAKGHVLIAGLGIGLILDPILEKCKSVTVIEKERDVVKIFAPAYPKAHVICADIFNWRPKRGQRFDTIYFDIWADICEDYLDEARKLHARYSRYLTPSGWSGDWMRPALRQLGKVA